MKRLIILVFPLLFLAACGRLPAAAPSAQGDAEQAAPACINGRAVSEGELRWWLETVCAEIRDACAAAGESVDWEAVLDGQTLKDYAGRQALESAALYAAVEERARACGVERTEAMEAEAEELWRERAAAHGGEEGYSAFLAERGLDRETARRLVDTHLLYRQLCRLAEEEGSALWAAQEELLAYFRREDYVTAQLLCFTGEDAAQRAAEAFAVLNASTEPEREFARLREQMPQEELPRTFQTCDGAIPAGLSAAAAGLEEGQLSGIVRCAEGCGIVLRLADDPSGLRQALLDEQLQTAAAESELTVNGRYEALLADFFRKEVSSLP